MRFGPGIEYFESMPFVINTRKATINGLDSTYCLGNEHDILSAIPMGGYFEGPLVNDTIFHPDSAGAGIHNIQYIHTDTAGCISSDNRSVPVGPFETAAIHLLKDSYCLNDNRIFLYGKPSYGVFDGTGVHGLYFYPDSAGLGMHTINYNYTDTLGCNTSATDSILIIECPASTETSFSPEIKIYPNPASIILTVEAADYKYSEVYNILGQPLLSSDDNFINVSALRQGRYILRIHLNSGEIKSKHFVLIK
jgi:hypothetical protein